MQRGWLGVAIQPVTPEVAESLGLKKPEGALVATVTDGSPAAKAGVRQGDVVLAFDGNTGDDAAGAEPRGRRLRHPLEGDPDRLARQPRGHARRPRRRDAASGRLGRRTSGEQVRQAAPRWRRTERAGPDPGADRQRARARVTACRRTRAERWWPPSMSARDAAEKGLKPGDVITRVNQEAVAGPVGRRQRRGKGEGGASQVDPAAGRAAKAISASSPSI